MGKLESDLIKKKMEERESTAPCLQGVSTEFVLIARQCTARCLQRVAQRTTRILYLVIYTCGSADSKYSIPYYIGIISAEPHVASNVRYIALQ